MNNLTEEEKQDILDTIKKRGKIYTIISLIFCAVGLTLYFALPALGIIIPYVSIIYTVCLLVWGITDGCAVFCVNNYRMVKSDGQKEGGGPIWLLLMILGVFIFPIIVVAILSRSKKLAGAVLGLTIT